MLSFFAVQLRIRPRVPATQSRSAPQAGKSRIEVCLELGRSSINQWPFQEPKSMMTMVNNGE